MSSYCSSEIAYFDRYAIENSSTELGETFEVESGGYDVYFTKRGGNLIVQVDHRNTEYSWEISYAKAIYYNNGEEILDLHRDIEMALDPNYDRVKLHYPVEFDVSKYKRSALINIGISIVCNDRVCMHNLVLFPVYDNGAKSYEEYLEIELKKVTKDRDNIRGELKQTREKLEQIERTFAEEVDAK